MPVVPIIVNLCVLDALGDPVLMAPVDAGHRWYGPLRRCPSPHLLACSQGRQRKGNIFCWSFTGMWMMSDFYWGQITNLTGDRSLIYFWVHFTWMKCQFKMVPPFGNFLLPGKLF